MTFQGANMGSINSLWIPTLAVAHILGILMWLYAVTRLAGPKKSRSKNKAKTKDTGGQEEKPAANHPSSFTNGHDGKVYHALAVLLYALQRNAEPHSLGFCRRLSLQRQSMRSLRRLQRPLSRSWTVCVQSPWS